MDQRYIFSTDTDPYWYSTGTVRNSTVLGTYSTFLVQYRTVKVQYRYRIVLVQYNTGTGLLVQYRSRTVLAPYSTGTVSCTHRFVIKRRN